MNLFNRKKEEIKIMKVVDGLAMPDTTKKDNLIKLKEEIDKELSMLNPNMQPPQTKEKVERLVKQHNNTQRQEEQPEDNEIIKYFAVLNERVLVNNENQLHLSNQLNRIETYLLRLPLIPVEEQPQEEQAQEEPAAEYEGTGEEDEPEEQPKAERKPKGRK